MAEVEIVILFLMATLLFGRFFLPENLFDNTNISRRLIPVSLLFLWVVLIIYQSYIIENVFTVLTDSYSSDVLSDRPVGEIFRDQVIRGKFTATENNLGILGFRFWTFYRLNADDVGFKIRRVGDKNWYYENTYKTDQFQPNQHFTFGFPVISDSQGKTYEFEIISLKGQPGDAVGISQIEPVFIAKYKYDRLVVVSGPKPFIQFCLKKLGNLTKNSNFTASSYIFLLPFLVYVVFIGRTRTNYLASLLIKAGYANKKNISLSLVVFGLICDILFIHQGSLSIVLLVTLFGYIIKTYRLGFQIILILSGLSLIISGLFMYFVSSATSVRAGGWAWILLSMWLTNQIWQLRKNSNSKADV